MTQVNTAQPDKAPFSDGSGVRRELSANELTVLERFFDTTHAYGEFCANFKAIAKGTDIDATPIRLACRSLAQMGLAEYWRGLMTEDGEVAGSGYCITAAGRELMEPILEARDAPSPRSAGRG